MAWQCCRPISSSIGKIGKDITRKLVDALLPVHLKVINESGLHNVPRGSETHFRIHIASKEFEGKSVVQRHRIVNKLLQEELCTGVHALSIVAQDPLEFLTSEDPGPSPPCANFNKNLD